MIKAILLDIDGTLVLSNRAHAQSWVDAFEQFAHEADFDKILKLIGMGGDKLIATVQPELNEEEGDGKKIKEARSKIFLDKYAPDLRPTPGSRQLVETLQERGLWTIAASSAKQTELDSLLKAAEVDDLLTEATTSDDAENSKPDPDIVQVALDRVGVPASDAVMIGDTPYDIQAAAKAGVRCVALRTGGWDDESLKDAVAIFDDPAELVANLDRILSENQA